MILHRSISSFMKSVEDHLERMGLRPDGEDVTWQRMMNYREHQLRADFRKVPRGYAGSLILREIDTSEDGFLMALWKAPDGAPEVLESVYGFSEEKLNEAAERIGMQVLVRMS